MDLMGQSGVCGRAVKKSIVSGHRVRLGFIFSGVVLFWALGSGGGCAGASENIKNLKKCHFRLVSLHLQTRFAGFKRGVPPVIFRAELEIENPNNFPVTLYEFQLNGKREMKGGEEFILLTLRHEGEAEIPPRSRKIFPASAEIFPGEQSEAWRVVFQELVREYMFSGGVELVMEGTIYLNSPFGKIPISYREKKRLSGG